MCLWRLALEGLKRISCYILYESMFLFCVSIFIQLTTYSELEIPYLQLGAPKFHPSPSSIYIFTQTLKVSKVERSKYQNLTTILLHYPVA
jgi:hypothetical protein